jgi:hypothetical protein
MLAALEAENRRIAVQSQWAHDIRAYLENTQPQQKLKNARLGPRLYSNMGMPLCYVPGFELLNDPQYGLNTICIPLLPTGKFSQIHNLRSHIYFHFTVLKLNLHVATTLNYLSQVLHVPITFTSFPEIIKDLHIKSTSREFFPRCEGYKKKDIKLFHKYIDGCGIIHFTVQGRRNVSITNISSYSSVGFKCQ